jgi:hypothetical protein
VFLILSHAMPISGNLQYICHMNVTKRLVVLALLLVSTFGTSEGVAWAATATKVVSVSTAEKNCKTVPSEEQGDFGMFRCGKPVGGWLVEIAYDDARDDLNLIDSAGKTARLNLYELHSTFSVLGPSINFVTTGQKASGLYFRYKFHTGEESTKTVLLVARLSPTPCVIAELAAKDTAAALQMAKTSANKRCLQPS